MSELYHPHPSVTHPGTLSPGIKVLKQNLVAHWVQMVPFIEKQTGSGQRWAGTQHH